MLHSSRSSDARGVSGRADRAKAHSRCESRGYSRQAKGEAANTSLPVTLRPRVSLPPDGSPGVHDASATPPILRLQTESGDSRADPSEDAMFMFMEDLGPGNAWLEVVRIGDRAGDAVRVIRDEELECFDIDVRQGSSRRRSRGLAFRVAHEVLTGWAFDLPDWDGRVPWDSPASAPQRHTRQHALSRASWRNRASRWRRAARHDCWSSSDRAARGLTCRRAAQ
jgi:hypothetical protein